MSFKYNKKNEEGFMTCDECGTEDSHSGDFKESVQQFRDDGWIVEKVDDEWIYTCPDCKR